MSIELYTADISYKRADVFLSNCTDYSRSRIQSWIEEGLVMVNGKTCRAKDAVRAGDVLSVDVPEPTHIDAIPEDIALDVVFEDNDICVINKPRGMVVHPAPGNENGTLVNALLHRFGELSNIGGEYRPGIVHRIDKMTSGLLVVAKNNAAHESLSEQFSTHTACRSYIAVVHGNIRVENGTIDAPIGRHPTDRKKMAVVQNGRNAVTHFSVIENLKQSAFVSCSLETGRTHQIRVHMAHIKHPLIGDEVYCSAPDIYHLGGQALHGYKLRLIHPRTGEAMSFFAPMPDCLEKLLLKLGWSGILPADYK